MGSREEIVQALRRNRPPVAAAPEHSALGSRFADPLAELARAIAGVGGVCVRVADVAAANAALAELPHVTAARKVVSLVPGVGHATLDLAEVADPHALGDLDLAILPGAFAVAENGAVWVDGRSLPHRAVFVITDHLVLVVPASAVVNDLHEAYARLGTSGHGSGVFISGPSKTADIEQALVIGAQGARTCTVLLVG